MRGLEREYSGTAEANNLEISRTTIIFSLREEIKVKKRKRVGDLGEKRPLIDVEKLFLESWKKMYI